MAESYSARRRAPLAELEELLALIGKSLKRHVVAYLIGGCAMSMRGLKDATKDADVIVRSRAEREALEQVMKGLGYTQMQSGPFKTHVPKEYEGFHGDIYQLDGKVGLDVFENTIMEDRFVLTDSMAARAKEVRRYGNLELRLCSNEDIFLFKSLTSRPDDGPDIMNLVQTGLDRKVMAAELRAQPARKRQPPWRIHVVEQLERLEERGLGMIPWKEELRGEL